MQFRRQAVKPEINVIPLLDILLVLVLILMATTPMVMQEIQVELPQEVMGRKRSDLAAKPQVILEIDASGSYALITDGRRLENISKEQLIQQVKERAQLDRQTVFLIGASATLPYEEVIRCLELLQKAGVGAVGLMTKSI